MGGVRRDLAESRRSLSRAAALALAALALTGCGASNEDDVVADSTSGPSDSPSGAVSEPILITTRVNLPTGEILDGSNVDASPFCPGGTVADQHGTPEIGFVDRTITCSDGTLRVGFDPHEPVGDTQRGPWRLISGTGAYKGWEGGGDFVTTYDANDKRVHPSLGRERFTGTVTRQERGHPG